ncbi:MAG: DUF1285 domain-containing protein [Novosphingobium sp.]
MPYEPPPELGNLSLAEIAALVAERKLPPVDLWRPERTGDSEMRIAADGRWYHQGGEITRPAMVRAFATLLVRDEDGGHWLVTPQEKLTIVVADAALVAVDVTQVDGWLTFRLNTDELVIAGPDHPIRAAGDPDTPALYLAVRHGIEARLNRSTYLQIIDIALQGDDLAVTSGGVTFALTPA